MLQWARSRWHCKFSCGDAQQRRGAGTSLCCRGFDSHVHRAFCARADCSCWCNPTPSQHHARQCWRSTCSRRSVTTAAGPRWLDYQWQIVILAFSSLATLLTFQICLTNCLDWFPPLSNIQPHAGAIECIAYHPKYAANIIRHGGVSALVGLLNAGTREAFLPTMRSLKQLSGELIQCLPVAICLKRWQQIMDNSIAFLQIFFLGFLTLKQSLQSCAVKLICKGIQWKIDLLP